MNCAVKTERLTLLEWITQAIGLKEMDGLQLIIQGGNINRNQWER